MLRLRTLGVIVSFGILAAAAPTADAESRHLSLGEIAARVAVAHGLKSPKQIPPIGLRIASLTVGLVILARKDTSSRRSTCCNEFAVQ